MAGRVPAQPAWFGYAEKRVGRCTPGAGCVALQTHPARPWMLRGGFAPGARPGPYLPKKFPGGRPASASTLRNFSGRPLISAFAHPRTGRVPRQFARRSRTGLARRRSVPGLARSIEAQYCAKPACASVAGSGRCSGLCGVHETRNAAKGEQGLGLAEQPGKGLREAWCRRGDNGWRRGRVPWRASPGETSQGTIRIRRLVRGPDPASVSLAPV